MRPSRIEWLDEASADVRRLDRTTAVLHARTGGVVAPLHGDIAVIAWQTTRHQMLDRLGRVRLDAVLIPRGPSP